MTPDEQEQEAKAWIYGLAGMSVVETGAMWASIGLAMVQAGAARSLQPFEVRPARK